MAKAQSPRSITPDDVRFLAADAGERNAACPACGRRGGARPVLRVPTLSPPDRELELIRCGHCASLFYQPGGIRDFSDLGGQDAGFWRFYVEAAGGIWETLWPVAAARARGRMLDVGCGFGFAVDFWSRSGRGEAVGVELAAYGAAGARALGVTIHDQRLEACEALAGQRFDVVYACEVVEHIDEPRAFVAMLAQRVADDGVLVLTTPAAEFVRPEHRSPGMLAALAPGFHGFLLSGPALESLARDAGFEHVKLRRFAERQVLWASRKPFEPALDEAALRADYFAYMRARVAELEPASPVGMGYTYRLLRDEVNTGHLADALPRATGLAGAIRLRFGERALEPDSVLAAYREATTLEDAGRIGPYFLPGFYHHAATLAQHVERDYPRARAWYRAAAELSIECGRIGAVLFLEAPTLVWPARIADAVLGLALGDESAAEGLLALMETGLEPSAASGYGCVSRERIEALLPPVIEELASRGQRASALRLAEGYRAYVAQNYEAALLTVGGVESALREERSVPLDPWFAPYTSHAFTATGAGPEASRAALADFAVRAEGAGSTATARGRELAAKARQLAGVVPPRRDFSFEMSFDLTPKR